MSLYRNSYKDEKDEEEPTTTGTEANDPNAPTGDNPEPTVAKPEEHPLDPESQAYKARYDSLKTHHDKSIRALRDENERLTAQIRSVSQNTLSIPKTKEEVTQWKTDYPEIYDMMLTIVRMENQDRQKGLDDKFSKIEHDTAALRREKAELELLKYHPDVAELRGDEKFHNWAKEQPKMIQDWLYANPDNPILAAKAISLYKAETGVKEPEPKREDKTSMQRHAAEAVTGTHRSNPPQPPQKKVWSIAEIEKMSIQEYEKHEKEIDEAAKEGRISD